MYQFKCPHCGEMNNVHLWIETQYILNQTGIIEAVELPSWHDGMKSDCPQCGHQGDVSDWMGGKFKCPGCKGRFKVALVPEPLVSHVNYRDLPTDFEAVCPLCDYRSTLRTFDEEGDDA